MGVDYIVCGACGWIYPDYCEDRGLCIVCVRELCPDCKFKGLKILTWCDGSRKEHRCFREERETAPKRQRTEETKCVCSERYAENYEETCEEHGKFHCEECTLTVCIDCSKGKKPKGEFKVAFVKHANVSE